MSHKKINNLEINEPVVEQSLEWLAKHKNNCLHVEQLTELVKVLLKRVAYLESKVITH